MFRLKIVQATAASNASTSARPPGPTFWLSPNAGPQSTTPMAQCGSRPSSMTVLATTSRTPPSLIEDLAHDAEPVADRVDQRVVEGRDGKVSTLAPINGEGDADERVHHCDAQDHAQGISKTRGGLQDRQVPDTPENRSEQSRREAVGFARSVQMAIQSALNKTSSMTKQTGKRTKKSRKPKSGSGAQWVVATAFAAIIIPMPIFPAVSWHIRNGRIVSRLDAARHSPQRSPR